MKVFGFVVVLAALAGAITAGVLSATSKDTGGACAACAPGSGTKEVEAVSGKSQVPQKQYDPEKLETAIFGAGCFWGVEAAFRKVEGVVDAAAGYCGGHKEDPTYKEVCAGATGHAEVVEVTYDTEAVSYEALLEVFWNGHDPTQLNRQGPDVGAQYRSVIFYFTPEQEVAARASKKSLTAVGRYPRPIVTAVEPAGRFWRAEEYHQRYLEKQGIAACPSKLN